MLLAGGRAPRIQTGSNKLENILIRNFYMNTVCMAKGRDVIGNRVYFPS
jgi:hypothetical protein